MKKANTHDFLSWGLGSNPSTSTKGVWKGLPEMKALECLFGWTIKYPYIFENGVIGNTRGFEPLILSSNLGSRAKYWHVVQLVERLTVNQEVASSRLAMPAKMCL